MSEDSSASLYSKEFFTKMSIDADNSASIVAPLLIDLVKPRSILDVGCGCGNWLKAFADLGVQQTFGIDGPWVQSKSLVIDPQNFRSLDLSESWSVRDLGFPITSFDLVICCEVAEHLHPRSSVSFVESLIRSAPVVLFSAALPGQRGTGHVNEQWPDYWRDIFNKFGYWRIDAVRPRIWKSADIAWYYRQNMFVFVNNQMLRSYPILESILQAEPKEELLLVESRILRPQRTLKAALRILPRLFWNACVRKLAQSRAKSKEEKNENQQ